MTTLILNPKLSIEAGLPLLIIALPAVGESDCMLLLPAVHAVGHLRAARVVTVVRFLSVEQQKRSSFPFLGVGI